MRQSKRNTTRLIVPVTRVVALLIGLVLQGIMCAGCSSRSDEPQERTIQRSIQALTSTQSRVLGFESPTEDWSSTAQLSSSTNASQGNHALGIKMCNWTQVTSLPISTLSNVADAVQLDIQLPVTTSWGKVRVIIRVPSKGVWYQDLGYRSLAGLSAGTYHTLEYLLPADLKAVLEQSYEDLQIVISIASDPSFSPYLVDNLVLTTVTEPSDTDTNTNDTDDPDEPSYHGRLCEFVAYSSNGIELRDRVHSLGGSVGSSTTVRIGVESRVDGHVEAMGDVFLSNNSFVDGWVRAGGAIHEDPPTTVTNGKESNASVTLFAIETTDISYGSDNINLYSGQQMTLPPGDYNEVHPYAGSELTFRTGTYNLGRFFVESSSVKLKFDVTDGPVRINIQGELRFGDNMQVELVGSDDPRLVTIYSNFTGQVKLGTDGAYYGTLIVPHGEIYVFSRMEVHGALYGKQVIVDTDTVLTGIDCPVEIVETGEEDCPESTPIIDVAWSSDGTTLVGTGIDVFLVDGGERTQVYDGQLGESVMLNDTGESFGVRSSSGHFTVYDRTGAVTGIITDFIPTGFVPDSDLLFAVVNESSHPEFLRVAQGHVINGSSTILHTIDVPGYRFNRLGSFYVVWAGKGTVTKTGFDNTTHWQTSIGLQSFEISRDGEAVIGIPFENQKIVHFVSGTPVSETVLEGPVFDAAMSPSGEFSSVITPKNLYIFKEGVLSANVLLDVAYGISTRVSDDGNVAVGAQTDDRRSQGLVFSSTGALIWQETKSVEERSAHRPAVILSGDGQNLVLRTKQSASFYAIERI